MVTLLFCVYSYSTFAQSTLRLTTLLDSLEKIMAKERIPGMMLSIVQNDSLVFSGGLGLADVKSKEKVDSNHFFRLGSVTKSFTALAVLKLQKAGKLDVNAKLKDLVPEIEINNPYEEIHPLRVIHLIEHTAGFDDMHFSTIYRRSDDGLNLLEQVRKQQKSLVCRWKPGTLYSYSNPGYSLLGYVIAKASGMAYEQYVKQEILQPLGMNDAHFIGFEPKTNLKKATGYTLRPKNEVKVAENYGVYNNAAGGLVAHADDMSNWLKFLSNPNSFSSALGLDSSDLAKTRLATSGISARQGITDNYAWAVSPGFYHLPLPFYGHDGGIQGFISYYGYQPQIRSGFVVSVNCMESTARVTRLIAAYLTRSADSSRPKALKIPETLRSSLINARGPYKKLNSRNELFRSSELMFSGLNFKFEKDTLFVSQLFGDPEPFVYAGGSSFTKVGHCCPSVHWIKNEEGIEMFQLDDFYSREVLPWSLFWRIIFFSGFIIGMALAVLGVIWCIMLITKGLNFREFQFRMLPVLSLASFMGLLFGISMAFGEPLATAEVNALTISLFACSSAFPILSLISFWVWSKRLWQKEFGFYSIFLFICSLIYSLFSVFMVSTGVFALMTWNG